MPWSRRKNTIISIMTYITFLDISLFEVMITLRSKQKIIGRMLVELLGLP